MIATRNNSYGHFVDEPPRPSNRRKVARTASIWTPFGQNRSHQLKLSFLKFSRILVAKNHTKFVKKEIFDSKYSPKQIGGVEK